MHLRVTLTFPQVLASAYDVCQENGSTDVMNSDQEITYGLIYRTGFSLPKLRSRRRIGSRLALHYHIHVPFFLMDRLINLEDPHQGARPVQSDYGPFSLEFYDAVLSITYLAIS